jgi:hypothetical protein
MKRCLEYNLQVAGWEQAAKASILTADDGCLE